MIGLVSLLLMGAAATPKAKVAHAAPPEPPAPIAQVMSAAHTAFRLSKADKFAATPTIPAAEGKSFKLTLRLGDGDVASGIMPNSGYYSYKNGTLEFVVSKDTNPRPYYENDKTELLYFSSVNTPGKSYVGRNAYGAATRVSVENWRRSALGIVSIPEGEELPYMAREAAKDEARGIKRMVPPSLDTYPYVVEVSGPEARQLVANVRVVIEGTMTQLASGKLTDCVTDYSEPKINAPYEISEYICWVGANITRIAYINTATGAVLKEFKSTD